MEDLLKEELSLSSLKSTKEFAKGCISNGQVYDSEKGKIFVKNNSKSGAKLMFDGEYAGLFEISSTKTVKVPNPMKVIDMSSGAAFAMEYLDMRPLDKHAKSLGRKLADLHLHNSHLLKMKAQSESYVGQHDQLEPVSQFGFKVTTCCGYLPLVNDWCTNWIEFYARNRLAAQIDMAERTYGDREARLLWPQVERNIPKLFPSDMKICPALLHGDLWSGNAGELKDEPCIFDVASFYGHSEFDLAIAHMYGGFPRVFFDEYHSVIPKCEGFNNRLELYKLFHYLNHWNHFGGGYRESSLSSMRTLAKL